ncbi:amidase family protein [Bacillus sp. BPN334]|uniref:amidase family protein n=1 Tax=Bacillus sp. BPN334 TaxID=2217815 RepID=UPI0011EFD5EE|nr:amidase family protein [Bacillus sp. BPN334]KAA0794823.1 amidase [Bacillus sp. BPN334]
MKKWMKVILAIAGGILVLLTAGGYYFYKTVISQIPEQAERIVYDKERVLSPLNNQLKGINIENIKKKEKDIVNATIDEIQKKVDENQLSYEELVSVYLLRIKEHDQNGVSLNAITEINPDAIEEARKLDKERTINKKSNLYGMPIIVKDNIQTADVMPTSAGTVVLKDWIADEDAFIIKNLKRQGALILGKANMSEWANYLSNKMPSGYSGKKGQNLNPYEPLVFDTAGSSSGSATVVAADFAPLAIGTETVGSIVAPASYQSVVGLRPSIGLISRTGIIPLSETLDTAGPMAKTVKDVAILLNTMVDFDEKDVMMKKVNDKETKDYTKDLLVEGLQGKKIGILFSSDQEDDMGRKDVLDKIRKDLQNAGAILTENINLNKEVVSSDLPTILKHEFKHGINTYLTEQKNIPVKSLKDVIEFNNKDKKRNVKYEQSLIEESADSSIKNETLQNLVNKARINAKKELDKYLEEKALDALVMIDNDQVILSAIAGYPELSIPAGYDSTGKPVGVTFIGKAFGEKELLKLGYAYEQQSQNRKAPHL